MASDRTDSSRPTFAQELAAAGGRAAARTMRPFTSAGIAIQRRTLDRVLESDELERTLMTVLESPHLQSALRHALDTDGARQLIDDLVDSGLLDRLFDRLIASEGLSRLIEEAASSAAVTTAITGQGLGFADRVGEGLRVGTRRADDWIDQAAGRIVHRRNP